MHGITFNPDFRVQVAHHGRCMPIRIHQLHNSRTVLVHCRFIAFIHAEQGRGKGVGLKTRLLASLISMKK
jgi:hypothetical protein